MKSVPGPLAVLDLPLVDFPEDGFMKCFADIVMDVPSFPSTEIKQVMQGKDVKKLPQPFGPARDPGLPVRLDLAILPQHNGKFCIVKIVNLNEKTKVEDVKIPCLGKPHAVDWARDVRANGWVSVSSSRS